MTVLGSPGFASATRLMLLGSGELGKEVAIEAQRASSSPPNARTT